MTAFYNEIEPYAAQWLRNLIEAGHIAPGIVDERDIRDIRPDELAQYTQCHFFAGIGIWSHSLRQAGWPDDRPIWTGSCPCQPFSVNGKRGGFDDERHLWPAWHWLIKQCRPAVVAGEQVAAALPWVDLVGSDLEGEGYAFGAGTLPAAGFGAAHRRNRIYFAAVDDTAGARPDRSVENSKDAAWNTPWLRLPSTGRGTDLLDDASDARLQGWSAVRRRDQGNSVPPSLASDAGAPLLGRQQVDWLHCTDGKWRPVESGTFPLADEDSTRVGKLRSIGNALDAATATAWCTALIQIVDGHRDSIGDQQPAQGEHAWGT